MPKLTIDGIEIEVEPGTSVLQACEQLGIEVPRFCYHERLSVPANCRMCLVEIEKSPKPVASCAMPCGEGMVVHTGSDMVRKARRGVMEFLLINHPLDCPICDQGGECDLQDQAVAYGRDRSRFGEAKRVVSEKEMGPLIKTAMTRCIQCTRCIRFVNEIAGVPALGAVGRGEHMEITTALEAGVNSEMSGNLIDVCPVGALTNKPYAFSARPWELRKTETIDVMDAVGCNIRADARGNEILRILPRTNDDINEDWIADKSRFACDGLKRGRLDRPYIRKDGKLVEASWDEAFAAIAARLRDVSGDRIAAVAGDLVDAEAMTALKDLMSALGSPNLDCRQDGATFDTSARAGWLFNSTIAGIEQADAILIIGSNLRWEAPIINARIRKRYLKGGLEVATIGESYDLTYPVSHLGSGWLALKNLLDGTLSFGDALRKAKRPMMIVGPGVLARPDAKAVQKTLCRIVGEFGLVREGWNGFNAVHTAAARVGGLEVGFLPGPGGRDLGGILEGASGGAVEAVYLLGADEIPMDRLGEAFVIYQGHHGDAGAVRADVVLPGAAYTEKYGTYVNVEGRPQHTFRAVFPPGEAREDWTILRALSDRLDKRLPYDDLSQLRARMADANPVFARIGAVTPAAWMLFGGAETIDDVPFASSVANYYVTDPISRASLVMAECADRFGHPRQEERTGAHG